MALPDFGGIDLVVFGDSSVNAKVDRLRLPRQISDAQRTTLALDTRFRNVNQFGQSSPQFDPYAERKRNRFESSRLFAATLPCFHFLRFWLQDLEDADRQVVPPGGADKRFGIVPQGGTDHLGGLAPVSFHRLNNLLFTKGFPGGTLRLRQAIAVENQDIAVSWLRQWDSVELFRACIR